MRLGLLILSLCFFPVMASAKEVALCKNIFLHDGHLKLNANEKVLICGSGDDSSWKDIPLPQAQFHLKTIFENLGYLSPRFERHQDRLDVWRGERTPIQSLHVTGADDVLNPDKKRKIIGAALTPDKLNEVQRWADLGLRGQGYPCPAVKMEAQAWDAAVYARVAEGPKQRIGRIRGLPLAGFAPNAFDRYQPFEVGDPYDIRETQLMAQRLLADGLIQSADFSVQCGPEDVDLTLNASVGKARILRFGVGASTEEFPFVELGFKNVGLDDRASSLTGDLFASPVRQTLTVGSELYTFPNWQRTFLGPRFTASHEVERSYEFDSANAGIDLGRNWDDRGNRFTARAGPSLNYSKTLQGIGPTDAKYLSIDGSLTTMSHLYEIASSTQDAGWNADFFYHGQRKGLGSDLNVNRYQVDAKSLWNIGHYSPPLFVLGARLQSIWVDADQVTTANDLLPIEDRIFYGGDQDLRGFPRQSLNNGGLGYLTAALLGFELRLVEELPYHLQPFLLWDGAKLGRRRKTWDDPQFISEGFGLRWASPFGTLRGSAARGRIFDGDATTAGYPQEWVYFLSFGQEF